MGTIGDNAEDIDAPELNDDGVDTHGASYGQDRRSGWGLLLMMIYQYFGWPKK